MWFLMEVAPAYSLFRGWFCNSTSCAAEDIPQGGQEIVLVERFLDKENGVFLYFMTGDHIGSVAGHIEAAKSWKDLLQPPGQFPAVHPGHDDIRYQQVDCPVASGGNA